MRREHRSSKAYKDGGKVKKTPSRGEEWSARTGIPQRLYTRSKEFTDEFGDPSRGVNEFGEPIYSKPEKGKKPSEGDRILRFR